jgi:hypothetical protein
LIGYCLFFLTGVNFIIFPQQHIEKKTLLSTSGKPADKDPSSPIEEKSSENNSPTVQEEYLHEWHLFDESPGSEVILYPENSTVEKLQTVHFELISPPPEA